MLALFPLHFDYTISVQIQSYFPSSFSHFVSHYIFHYIFSITFSITCFLLLDPLWVSEESVLCTCFVPFLVQFSVNQWINDLVQIKSCYELHMYYISFIFYSFFVFAVQITRYLCETRRSIDTKKLKMNKTYELRAFNLNG